LNKIKIKGFSLIELLAVVAILGALAAIGIVSYNGYVSGAKKSAAKNTMQQIALMQTEYNSLSGDYYTGASCPPSEAGTELIDTNLFDAEEGENAIEGEGYEYCVTTHTTGFQIQSCPVDKDGVCDGAIMTLDAKGQSN